MILTVNIEVMPRYQAAASSTENQSGGPSAGPGSATACCAPVRASVSPSFL